MASAESPHNHSVEIVTGISLLVIGVAMLTPILMYYLYQFYCVSIACNDLVKYRNKTLVYCMNGLAILSLCTERVFIILSQILHVFVPIGPVWLAFIAEYSFMFGFYTLFLIKTWLSFYEYEYQRKLADLSWTQDVNPTTSQRKKNKWFIKQKHKLGNFNFLIKIGVIFFAVQITTEILVDVYVGHDHELVIDHVITLVYTIFVFIVSLILYLKTKGFNDIYHIKKEIQYQTYILLTILFIDTIAVTYEIIYDWNKPINDDHGVEWIVSVLISDTAWFSICLISTAYPVYLYKQRINSHKFKPTDVDISKPHNSYLSGLLHTISHKDGFKSLMLHLVKEYSTENLLFLLELVQIKSEFQCKNRAGLESTNNDISESEQNPEQQQTALVNSNGKIVCDLMVPSHLPQSVILERQPEDLWLQMLYLYEKYVKCGSDLELNISYESRSDLQNVFEKKSEDEPPSHSITTIFHIMDGCAIDIVKLLFDSFQRFTDTESYLEMKRTTNKSSSRNSIRIHR